MWLLSNWLWWQYFIWVRFFLLVSCSPQGASSNVKVDFSLALWFSASYFNVAAQVKQVEKDGNTWWHENNWNWMCSFLSMFFLSSFLLSVFFLQFFLFGFVLWFSCFKNQFMKHSKLKSLMKEIALNAAIEIIYSPKFRPVY